MIKKHESVKAVAERMGVDIKYLQALVAKAPARVQRGTIRAQIVERLGANIAIVDTIGGRYKSYRSKSDDPFWDFAANPFIKLIRDRQGRT
jgi:hypothetical protein